MLKRRLMFVTDNSEAGAGPASTEDTGSTPEAGAENTDAGSQSEAGSEAPKEDDLPDHWRNELSSARNDAARYRNRLREAEQRLEGAKSADEFEAAVAEYKTQLANLETDLARERVARKHNLPDDLAARLKGANEEEMEADAKTLAAYIKPSRPAPVTTPGGGLDPSDSGDIDTSPEALAKRFYRAY